MRFMDKKDSGNMSTGLIVGLVVGLLLIAIFLFVVALIGSKFMESTTDATAIDIMNDTILAIKDIPDYFPLLILMTIVVAIMLLVALVIVVIRRTGFLSGGSGDGL